MHIGSSARMRSDTRRRIVAVVSCLVFLAACDVVMPSLMFAEGSGSVGGIAFPVLNAPTVEQIAASVAAHAPAHVTVGAASEVVPVRQGDGSPFTMTTPSFGEGRDSSVEYTPRGESNKPVALGYATTTPEDTPVLLPLRYRSGVGGGAVTFATTTSPLHGTLGRVVGNAVWYTPDADWYGRDSFGFVVDDGSGTNMCGAVVRITVTPVNDTPTITLNGDNPLYVTVGDPFVDPGATVRDVEDGTKVVHGIGVVDTSTTSLMILSYRYVDRGGAIATTTRTVLVSATRTYASETHITNDAWLRGSSSWAGWEFPVDWSVIGSSNVIPTGSVTVWVNGTVACTSAAMVGTCAASSTVVGTSTVQVSYSGDATYRASVSAPVPHRIVLVAEDVCLNLGGIQASLPDGYRYEGGMCVPISTSSGGGSCMNCDERGDGGTATAAPVRTGGTGGERTPNTLRITNERGTTSETGTATATWNTNVRATGRVVCGPVSDAPYRLDRSAPNFGYPFGSPEMSERTTDHAALLEGLLPGTYHCRVASRMTPNAPWTISDEFILAYGGAASTVVAMGGGLEAEGQQAASPEAPAPTETEADTPAAPKESSAPGQLAAALASLGNVFSWGTCSGAWLPWIVVLCALVYATLWPRALLVGTLTLVGGMQRLSVLAALGIAGTLLALALDKGAWVIPLAVGTAALMAAFGTDLYAQSMAVPERFLRVLRALVGILACAFVVAIVRGWTCAVLPIMVLIVVLSVRYALRRANA